MSSSSSLSIRDANRIALSSAGRVLAALAFSVIVGGTLVEFCMTEGAAFDRLLALINQDGTSFWLPATLVALLAALGRWQLCQIGPQRRGPGLIEGAVVIGTYCGMVTSHLALEIVMDASQGPNGYQYAAYFTSWALCVAAPLLSLIMLLPMGGRRRR